MQRAGLTEGLELVFRPPVPLLIFCLDEVKNKSSKLLVQPGTKAELRTTVEELIVLPNFM